MAIPYNTSAFSPKVQSLFNMLDSNTPAFSNPLLVSNYNTTITAVALARTLIVVLDPATYTDYTTDYTVDLYTALTAAYTAYTAKLTALNTHLSHQISTAPILFSQAITATSIRRTVNTTIGPDDIIIPLTVLLRGGFDTACSGIIAALVIVNNKLAILKSTTAPTSEQLQYAVVIAASITALTNAITTCVGSVGAQIAAEDVVEAGINQTILNFGMANVLVSIAGDTGFATVKAAAGTSALTNALNT